MPTAERARMRASRTYCSRSSARTTLTSSGCCHARGGGSGGWDCGAHWHFPHGRLEHSQRRDWCCSQQHSSHSFFSILNPSIHSTDTKMVHIRATVYLDLTVLCRNRALCRPMVSGKQPRILPHTRSLAQKAKDEEQKATSSIVEKWR